MGMASQSSEREDNIIVEDLRGIFPENESVVYL